MPRVVGVLVVVGMVMAGSACLGGGSDEEAEVVPPSPPRPTATLETSGRPPRSCSPADGAGPVWNGHDAGRFCGPGSASFSTGGRTYVLRTGFCTNPRAATSRVRDTPRTEHVRWVSFGVVALHGLEGDYGLTLVIRPSDQPGRVVIEDGEVQVGSLHVLARGTATVAPGLMTGTFTVVGPTLDLALGRAKAGTRNVVRGAWRCR